MHMYACCMPCTDGRPELHDPSPAIDGGAASHLAALPAVGLAGSGKSSQSRLSLPSLSLARPAPRRTSVGAPNSVGQVPVRCGARGRLASRQRRRDPSQVVLLFEAWG